MLTLDPNNRLKINDIINHKWLQSDSDYNIFANNNNNNSNNKCDTFGTYEFTINNEFTNLPDKIEKM